MFATVCAFCDHTNPAGSSFCNECGASLQLNLCPGCEAINHRNATNCHKCGAALPNASSIEVIANDSLLGESVGPPASTTVIAAMSPVIDEAIPAPEAKPALPLRRSSAAFVALPLIAVAAVVYYAYHNRDVAPPDSTSMRHSAAITERSTVMGTSEVGDRKALEARPETMATNSADAKTELPSALNEEEPAQIEPAPAESKPDNASASENPPEEHPPPAESPPAAAPTRSARDGPRPKPRDRGGSVPASKSGPGVSIAPPTLRPPSPGAGFQPPAACSDAVAALGLCKRNNPDEGK
jgi:hypothetical protein